MYTKNLLDDFQSRIHTLKKYSEQKNHEIHHGLCVHMRNQLNACGYWTTYVVTVYKCVQTFLITMSVLVFNPS
jgi:hypothetical protein